MSQNSAQQDGRPSPDGPSIWDIVVQAALTTATFAVVSAVAGPAVGTVVATLVGRGSGGDGGAGAMMS